MIYDQNDIRKGFEVSADAVIVGSGAAGPVAAHYLARAGMKTVVVEAGPQVPPEEMTRDAPAFMARYFWEGGLRILGGSAQIPSMAGRCLGGGTVVNSAIMLKLPDWVRELWASEEGLESLRNPEFDEAFERIFERTRTTPTPMAVMGRRNLLVKEAMEAVGINGGPLPRAVVDCHGCGDCLTGCFDGHKQSTDRCYLPDAEEHGAEIYTCSEVDRVLMEATKATGVTGYVVDPLRHEKIARFTVRAPLVILAAGTLATPVILLRSGINANKTVGRSLMAHIGGGIVGIMDELVDPWIGAAQGYGAISEDIRGMKFECLWAAPSVIACKFGGIGTEFLQRLSQIKHAVAACVVYRGDVRGKVTVRRNGMPNGKLWIPQKEFNTVLRGIKLLADGLLKVGAKYVHTGVRGVPDEMKTLEDTETLLSGKFGPKDVPMTANHIFSSCRMSGDPRRGTVNINGKVHGLEGLYICDGSIFPSSSGVNPQATIMALADLISRRLAGLES